MRKVALIGKAPSSVNLAPYDVPEWEVWILNTLGYMKEVPRWSVQFELHDIELTKDPSYKDYYKWLEKQSHGPNPIYLRDVIPPEFGPAARPFPLQEVRQTFKRLVGKDYITNTVSWMLVLAIHQHMQGDKISDIGLWGIDMAQHGENFGHAGAFQSEYAKQRPSCEYWIGVAEGLGINVTVPPTSDILKCACLYGYHTNALWKKMNQRKNELGARIAQAQQREAQAHDEAVFLSGAQQGMLYDLQWFPQEDK